MRFITKLFFILISFSIISCTALDANNSKENSRFTTQSIVTKKAILVTGASSGLGEQIALTLSKNGFYVYAGARKSKDIQRLNNIPNMQGIRLDVTKQGEIDAAVQYVKDQGRGLYGVVNNAGVFLFDPLIEVSERDMQFIMDVNVLGPYRVTKSFAPLIIANEGRITTIGSVAGLFSGKMFGPYGMSKHAMEAYTEALAQEMQKFSVKVSIVEPGNFKSNIMKNMKKRLDEIDYHKRETQYRDEIAGMANFTKTDRSHHASPQPVADAVLEFMTSKKTKLRYMVTPNQGEADFTLRRSLQKVIELNKGHRHSKSNEDLEAMLSKLHKGKQ